MTLHSRTLRHCSKMTHLWLALCLVAAAGLPTLRLAYGQQLSVATTYCDRAGRTVLIDWTALSAEVLLVTAYPNSGDMASPGMLCQFQIAAPGNGYMLKMEIERNPSLPPPPSSRLEIRDATGGHVLATTDGRAGSDRQVPLERTHLVSRPGSLISVTFETPAAGGPWQSVSIRLRRFVGCPPGWKPAADDLEGFCFSPLASDGTGGSGRQLDFATSQLACNAMRSNLLMGGSFNGNLSYHSFSWLYEGVLGYRSDAWIGLTKDDSSILKDTFPLQWMDGSAFRDGISPDDLRCASSWTGSGCRKYEKCAYYQAPNPATQYSGPVLDRCRYPSATRRFACYMPRNGTDNFFGVPGERQVVPLLLWLLPTVTICGVMALILLAVAMRRRRRRLALMACDGRQPILAVPPPPPPCYEPRHQYDAHGRPVQWYGAAGHVQQQYQQQYQHQHQHQQQQGPCPPQYQPQVQAKA